MISIVDFRKAVEARIGVSFMLDPGPTSWWTDIFNERRTITINYRDGKGFGFYIKPTDSYGYGEGPDEVITELDAAVNRVVDLMSVELMR